MKLRSCALAWLARLGSGLGAELLDDLADSPLPADGRLFVAAPAVVGEVSSFWTCVVS